MMFEGIIAFAYLVGLMWLWALGGFAIAETYRWLKWQLILRRAGRLVDSLPNPRMEKGAARQNRNTLKT